MGKNYSKAAKRRAKKALPKLAETPRRAKQGRARMKEIRREAHPQVLDVRMRQVGGKDRDAMRAEILSDGAGQALYLCLDPDMAKSLYGHYAALTAAQRRYHLSIGVSVHPKTAKIEFMPEVFETREDHDYDLRPQEERDEDAAKTWAVWCERLDELGLRHGSAIMTAIQGFAPMVECGAVTPAGARFVTAMKALDRIIN